MQKILIQPIAVTPKGVLVRATRQTRQGVRDLNSLDGRGYNGNRTTSCTHYRDPSAPTRVGFVETIVPLHNERGVQIGKRVKIVNTHYCLLCGEKRFDSNEGD
jgi:hypothetical protein